MPNPNNDELWRVNDQPFVIIHLSIKKRDRKKKDKKKQEKKKEDKKEGEVEEEDDSEDDDKNKVIYRPSIKDCQQFILNSMEMIIKSTNSVHNLEADLMPFLTKSKISNFPIDANFPWIHDACEKLNQMV